MKISLKIIPKNALSSNGWWVAREVTDEKTMQALLFPENHGSLWQNLERILDNSDYTVVKYDVLGRNQATEELAMLKDNKGDVLSPSANSRFIKDSNDFLKLLSHSDLGMIDLMSSEGNNGTMFTDTIPVIPRKEEEDEFSSISEDEFYIIQGLFLLAQRAAKEAEKYIDKIGEILNNKDESDWIVDAIYDNGNLDDALDRAKIVIELEDPL